MQSSLTQSTVDMPRPNLSLKDVERISPLYWAERNRVMLQMSPFEVGGHEYQMVPLQSNKRIRAEKKGARLGFTEIEILRSIHGMIYNRLPAGVLYLFPTADDVTDFSKARFSPLIESNPLSIGRHVQDTDAATIKRIGTALLYLRGARSTTKVEGVKADSSKLRSIGVDKVVFDEYDLMDPKMVDMALVRMDYSKVKEEVYLSTPTIPDWGIDRKYCLHPSTQVLKADLTWDNVGNLKVGDRLVGFDEEKSPGNKTRCLRETTVTTTGVINLPSTRISFSDGRSVVCSLDHMWLIDQGTNARWRKTSQLKVGYKLISIGDPWKTDDTRIGGWLAGMFDGEGCLSTHLYFSESNRCFISTVLSVSQKRGEVFFKLISGLNARGFDFSLSEVENNLYRFNIKGGIPAHLRLLGTLRPYRLLESASKMWDGASLGAGGYYTKPVVTNIEHLGDTPLISIGTEHKTLIAEGLLSHNSQSDQQVWMIKCQHCNEWTCLELEFPECVVDRGDGTGMRLCRKCRQEIYPRDGQWCAQNPGREIEGFWISQLNLMTVDPLSILKLFLNPPNGNIQEVYNSKLGMAYIAAENRLTPHDLWPLCSQDISPISHEGPTAMGVDVGNNFHVTIVDRPNDRQHRIVKICEVTSKKMDDFTPLHDLARQYNVRACVIDFAPVQQKVRSFREAETYEVFGCIYQEHQRGPASWDVIDGIVRVNRTEVCDQTHDICMRKDALIVPRRSPEIEKWVAQMCNLAKVLEEDKATGARDYHYRRLGPDHYRHSLNYAMLAAQRIGVYVPSDAKKQKGWRVNEKGTWRSI